MDKQTMSNADVVRSEQFRTPLGFEKELGMWVDRIGKSTDSKKTEKLRILGLYAAVYIEKGGGYYVSGTAGAKEVGAGDVMMVYPDRPTRYYPKGEWKTRWIVWGGSEAKRLEEAGFLAKAIIRDKYECVKGAHAMLSRLQSKGDLESVLERKKVLIQMILDLYRVSREAVVVSHNEAIIRRLLDQISENPAGDYPITKLARQCNLSVTHFRRLFAGYTGGTPKEFILSLKISRAKQLLSEGMTIKETAELAGFNDVFYFMRVFKKTTGITAGTFSRGA